jgi:hypothetical protein
VQGNQTKENQMNTLEETLDMMRDEFTRIAAKNEATEEIKTLCQRAIMNITVRVPLIVQRDKAEREARLWETRYNEQTHLAADVLTERDALGELLERADEALGDSGLGSQGSPLRVEIHEALKNYRMAKRVREGTNAEVRDRHPEGGNKNTENRAGGGSLD